MAIPFNKPFLTGKETHYIYQAVQSGKLSGNGIFTRRCQNFFEKNYGFKKCLLTTSCTDALEMCAILLDIQPGDEVILPSFTFVSGANAFALRGAKLIFVDSSPENPNMDVNLLEKLITPKTKAIVPMHYAGVACQMDEIMELAEAYDLMVVEDAAQAIDAFYKERPLGGVGHLGTFSFHETKNIISGEGGMLAINDERLIERAEIIWEKGTNRSAFFRGEVAKYSWVDLGSSFLPSEVTAAFLFAQLENLNRIQEKRKKLWDYYFNNLRNLAREGFLKLPVIPEYAVNNGHLFYVLCKNETDRQELLEYLQKKDIHAVFHYIPLHSSPYFRDRHDGRSLSYCDSYSEKLLRLPLFFELKQSEQDRVIQMVYEYYKKGA